MNLLRIIKHPAFEWTLLLGIPAILYLTGWHTETIGGLQRMILATGIIKADTEQNQTDSSPDADYNVNLQTLDGKDISLKELKGKVIFMNIWATWCPPCIAEMPGIQKLYEQVKSEDIAFVMISVDENPAKAQKFIKRKEYTFPVYQLTSKAIPQMYASESIPVTFVISASGKLVLKHSGMADYNSDAFRDFLRSQVSK
ncbi:TlpA disulfide reductase family protein [Xanthocytophaga agilis]|uniref:TlpA disulfide reductase family protein n=1 Tax=Xanthocytophaga agilis TaxID=3048010 RepID=A0AAE3UBM5_9BACT|nr:TlpA disulfide reductase family protein [Xanthocytophaga agilis]MDJ1499215.1 TlpA disulfide reductase family protein [Xanthocytophaga agilis]